MILTAAVGIGPAVAQAHPHAPGSAGPGSLFIVGGGRQGSELVERFVELAGGPDGGIAVVPLASSDPEASGRGKVEQLVAYGASAFVLLTSAAEAHHPATLAALDTASAVWFTGGDQSRITVALGGSPLLDRLRELHAAGLPLGGTSAGAAIMSPWMITGSQYDVEGDSIGYFGDEFPGIARERIEVVPGLGFLPGAVVDQHFLRRERHNRLISVVLEHPQLIGVGIDESTALEVDPSGVWRVHGASAVLVVDARGATVTNTGAPVLGAADITLHLLPPGSSFDPRTRQVRIQ